MGDESVRIRSRPDTVGALPRITCDRGLDAIDQRVDVGTAPIREQFGPVTEHAAVRRSIAYQHGRARAPQPPAIDLVDREGACPAALDGDPRVHGEIATPAECAGRIDLHYGLARRERIGRQADWFAAGRAPVGCR